MFRQVGSSKEELWRSRLRRFRSSGMSVTRFCQSQNVSVPSFYQWRKRLALEPEKKDVPLFMPVHVTGRQPSSVEVHLPNGSRVCVPPGDTESLRIAIETAARMTCLVDQEADSCSP